MNKNEEKKEIAVVYEVEGETIKLTPSIVQADFQT